MYNTIEYKIEDAVLNLDADATVDLKLEIPSGTYFLKGKIDIAYQHLDDDYDYWLDGIVADVITEDGDDVAKIVVTNPSKLSKATKDLFQKFLEQLEVQDRIYCEELESW